MQPANKKRPGGWAYKHQPKAEDARRKAQVIRIQAADEHLVAGVPVPELAVKYGIALSTVRDWVTARRKVTVPRREVQTTYERRTSHQDLTHGAGGQMTDREVRNATLRLERSLVALQAKLGFGPFLYSKAGVSDE